MRRLLTFAAFLLILLIPVCILPVPVCAQHGGHGGGGVRDTADSAAAMRQGAGTALVAARLAGRIWDQAGEPLTWHHVPVRTAVQVRGCFMDGRSPGDLVTGAPVMDGLAGRALVFVRVRGSDRGIPIMGTTDTTIPTGGRKRDHRRIKMRPINVSSPTR